MKRGKRRGKSSPKLSLNLPDLDQAKFAVLNSLPSKESQRGYRHAIDEFITWYCSEPRLFFNKAVVTRYRIHLESRQLAPGTINRRLAAVRRLAYARHHRNRLDVKSWRVVPGQSSRAAEDGGRSHRIALRKPRYHGTHCTKLDPPWRHLDGKRDPPNQRQRNHMPRSGT